MIKGIKLNIYTKLLGLFLLLSLLPLIILGLVSYRNARQTLEENIGYKLEELARLAMERVDHQLARHSQEIQTWADLEVMQDVLTGDADGRINATLADFKKSNPSYHQLNCFNQQGQIIASSEPWLIGKTMGGKESFKQAITGQVYISELTRLENGKGLGIAFSAPIKIMGHGKRVIGVLSTMFDWEDIYPLLENIRIEKAAEKQLKGAHIMIINRDGIVIFAPEWERRALDNILKQVTFTNGIPGVDTVNKNQTGYTIQLDEHDQFSLIGYALSSSHGDYSGSGWIALALQDLEQAFVPVSSLRRFMLISFIALALAAIAIAHLFAQQLTIPLKSLTQAARRIAQKAAEPNAKFTESIQVKSSDEIGALAESFDHMAQALQDRNQRLDTSYRELEGYKNRLEEMVEEKVAELKSTQEQLVQAGKMAAIGQLAAGVSHELNNPLGGILGYSQFILEIEKRKGAENLGPDRLKNIFTYVGYIERESQRCKTIVANLLKFSRASKTDIAQLDINHVLEETILFTHHQLEMHKVELIHKFAPGLPPVVGNEHQLQQVFTNIMVNAQQAMPKGGKLMVSTARNNGVVEVAFTDTGCGIPKEHLDKLFEPFFTTKETGEGTGLGLSVSYGIIKTHKGKIEVESEPGKGTTFRIKLPVEAGDTELQSKR